MDEDETDLLMFVGCIFVVPRSSSPSSRGQAVSTREVSHRCCVVERVERWKEW